MIDEKLIDAIKLDTSAVQKVSRKNRTTQGRFIPIFISAW